MAQVSAIPVMVRATSVVMLRYAVNAMGEDCVTGVVVPSRLPDL
jgi:hypothetical protein